MAFDAHDGCGGEVGEENYLFADELLGLVGEGDTGNDCSLFKAMKDRASDYKSEAAAQAKQMDFIGRGFTPSAP